MKIMMGNTLAAELLTRGGVAAKMKTAQSDEAQAKDHTKSCVKITASEDGVIFESSIDNMAARHRVPVGDLVSVKDPGVVCIPVTELSKVIGQGSNNHYIRISFTANPDADKLDHTTFVQSNGTALVEILDGDKVKAKVKIKAYPESEFEASEFKTEPVTLSSKASSIKDAYESIAFAINVADFSELYNKMGLFNGDKSLYFVGTNGRRCAILELKGEGIDILSEDVAILVDAELIKPALDVFPPNADLTIVQEEDKLHIAIVSGETVIRLYTVDSAIKAKFPDWRKVMALPMTKSISMNRSELIMGLKIVATANKDRSKYRFPVGSEEVEIVGKGIGAMEDVTSFVTCDPVTDQIKSREISLSTSYFLDACNRLGGDKIVLALDDEEKRLKVESLDNPEFTYLMQRMFDDEK